MDNVVERLGRAALAVGCAAALGCYVLTDPLLPDAAERFTPPPTYARWWALTEACSGITRPLSDVQFYQVPLASSVPTNDHGDVAGYWSPASNRIVLAGAWADDGRVVRHEMLHALVRGDGHPPAYFQGACEGVVDCPVVGCIDAGPAPVRAPFNAEVLPMAALEVRVELLPAIASRTGADSVLSIVIRVTNPRSTPVRVPLEGTPSVPGAPVYAGFFGFAVRAATSSSPIIAMQQSIPSGSLPFAAGETRQHVFDLNVRRFVAGEFTVQGLFNNRQASFPFRLTP